MGGLDVTAMVTTARRATLAGDPDVALASLDRALEVASSSEDRGRLLLARAIAQQSMVDPEPPIRDAMEATRLLRASGFHNEAAYAAAGAAVFCQRAGRIGDAVDHAVTAMVLRAESAEVDPDWVRAANGVALLFGQLSAFELAMASSIEAFGKGDAADPVTQEITAYTLCFTAVEGLHSGVSIDPEPARRAAVWLRDDAETDAARLVLGPGMLAELALLGEHDGDAEELAATMTDTAADVSPRVAAWRDLVGASVAHSGGRPSEAVGLLDRSLPRLVSMGDEHRVVRGYRVRGAAKAELGDLRGAYDDARVSAAMIRRSQVEQVGRLATQIQRRADLEVARSALRRRADDLAREVSTDAVTGVGSRRWFDLEVARLTATTGWGAVLVIDLDHFKSVND
ncbi:MAG: GGDEF domain-containing protein, partial [Actinomycetota bacterium]